MDFRKTTTIASLALLTFLAAIAAAGEPVVLFDGTSLENFDVLKCEAEIQDGAILIKSGNGLVQTKEQYGDFVLEYEWKALRDERWDSGVYFRYAEVPAGRPWPGKYQVNLRFGMEGDLVGSKEGVNKVELDPKKWNKFELTLEGETASLKVNGKESWTVGGIEVPKGYISVQAEVPGGGQFLFRNIKITELK
jgi:hypothetical protein